MKHINMVKLEGRTVMQVVKRQNRRYNWVRVVGRIGDEQVVGRRVDDQTLVDEHMMINLNLS